MRRRTKVREEAREYILNHKLTHPCSQCGESDPVVLDFHHLKGKGANIGKLIADAVSLERIKIEVSLCIVLCSNCHRKLPTKKENNGKIIAVLGNGATAARVSLEDKILVRIQVPQQTKTPASLAGVFVSRIVLSLIGWWLPSRR